MHGITTLSTPIRAAQSIESGVWWKKLFGADTCEASPALPTPLRYSARSGERGVRELRRGRRTPWLLGACVRGRARAREPARQEAARSVYAVRGAGAARFSGARPLAELWGARTAPEPC